MPPGECEPLLSQEVAQRISELSVSHINLQGKLYMYDGLCDSIPSPQNEQHKLMCQKLIGLMTETNKKGVAFLLVSLSTGLTMKKLKVSG